jgi:hypothetical protein
MAMRCALPLNRKTGSLGYQLHYLICDPYQISRFKFHTGSFFEGVKFGALRKRYGSVSQYKTLSFQRGWQSAEMTSFKGSARSQC